MSDSSARFRRVPASGHFGLGHGRGAHASDEYYLISTNPKVKGYDGAVMLFVDYLYALSK